LATDTSQIHRYYQTSDQAPHVHAGLERVLIQGMTDLAIDLRNVEKTYGRRVYALRGIEMRVQRGEVFGLLGPNGAGKSTLVKIMMTVVKPTRAEGSLLGRPIGEKRTLADVGYLPENHRFPRYLTGRQTLEFFGAMAGLPRVRRRAKAAQLLDTVGMSQWADRRIGLYSKGMMQRVGLAQAMMNDPKLIVLDEPTDGVDPVGRREIRDVLGALRSQGVTVFINSHLLSELELICDRVAILLGGVVAKQGTLDELAAARQRYEIEFAPEADATDLADRVARALGADFALVSAASPILAANLPGDIWIQLEGPILRLGTTDAAAIQKPLDQLRRAGLTIRRLQMMRPTLEDLFIEAVNDQNQGLRQTAGANVAALVTA
jgi:ABC-2 type transport system ATP-binding protein